MNFGCFKWSVICFFFCSILNNSDNILMPFAVFCLLLELFLDEFLHRHAYLTSKQELNCAVLCLK